ncbi:hypothetical protein LC040_03980 [Bacillus tianshenii]|nr:hypothetical protein LC040_03980 [Bacillus tianshenii]
MRNLIFILLTLILVSCSNSTTENPAPEAEQENQQEEIQQEQEEKEQEQEPASEESTEEPANQEEKQPEETKSTPQNEQKQKEPQDKLTETEAETLVLTQLQLSKSDSTKVKFDHMDSGNYIIHVYDVIDEGKETEHNATLGWYIVNPETKTVKSMF